MAIFMKIKGTEGNATAKGYETWIELESLSFGSSLSIKTHPGQAKTRSHSMVSFSEVDITKRLDKASNPLFDSICVSENIPEIEIHVCRTGTALTPYAKYIFHDVLVSEHKTYVSGEGIPQEHLRLNYVKLHRTYVHSNGTPYTTGYDMETLRPV